MQHRPHVEIRITNFLVEGLSVIRTKHIEDPVREVGGRMLRSGKSTAASEISVPNTFTK